MKALIWKLRFTIHVCRLTQSSIQSGWAMAGAWLEMLHCDTDVCPYECVEDELSRSND